MTRAPGRQILLIASGLGTGGAELQFCQLALRLASRGWSISVVSCQEGGAYRGYLERNGIRVIGCPVGRIAAPAQLVRLWLAIRRVRPDLVYTQAFRANLWGRIAALSLGIPCVASVRATYSYLPRPYLPIERLLALPTRRIVTPSEATSPHLIRTVGIASAKIITIPNGVDTALFSPARDGSPFRSRWNLEGKIVVFFAGRLAPQKNPLALLQAFALFAAREPRAVLVIAGSGPLEGRLRQSSQSLAGRLAFVGELGRDAVADAMAACDIVCQLSEFEGMPNTLLEAMASARPVVATGVDGVPEIVTSGVHGLLVARGDVEGAARALSTLAADPALRGRYGMAGRAAVEEWHSIDVNVDAHVRLYEEILGASGL